MTLRLVLAIESHYGFLAFFIERVLTRSKFDNREMFDGAFECLRHRLSASTTSGTEGSQAVPEVVEAFETSKAP